MHNLITSTAAMLVIPVAGWFAAAPTPAPERAMSTIEGTWITREHDANSVQLTLKWGSSTWGKPISRADVTTLAGTGQAGSVSLRIQREAGTFSLDGSVGAEGGAGAFRFEPNPAFGATLRALGISDGERAGSEDLLKLAVAYRSAEEIRELTTLGLGTLHVRDVIELAVFDITPAYVRALRDAGVPGTRTAAGLVQLRVHRVTPAYMRELAALGFRDVGLRQLLDMGIHGVSRAQVEALRELGYRDLSANTLVQMRIHQVTPEFIRQARAAGYDNPSPSTLIQLRIHGLRSRHVQPAGNR